MHIIQSTEHKSDFAWFRCYLVFILWGHRAVSAVSVPSVVCLEPLHPFSGFEGGNMFYVSPGRDVAID